MKNALEAFDEVRQKDPTQDFTLRFLFGMQAKFYSQAGASLFRLHSHLTIGYLGKIEKLQLAALLKVLEGEPLTKVSQEHLQIIGLRRVGPQQDLYAFTIKVGPATEALLRKLWGDYGELEAWQVKEGYQKQALPPCLHITLGQVNVLAKRGFDEAALKQYIGQKISLNNTRIELKPVGPFEPIYKRAVRKE